MPDVAEPLTRPDISHQEKSKDQLDPGYIVICWNDPVNLMDYVTRVFQRVFGWNKQKAEFHMMEVHNKGKSILAHDTLEKAEFYVHQLQMFSLHATMEKAE